MLVTPEHWLECQQKWSECSKSERNRIVRGQPKKIDKELGHSLDATSTEAVALGREEEKPEQSSVTTPVEFEGM